jgi:hypothetical protein
MRLRLLIWTLLLAGVVSIGGREADDSSSTTKQGVVKAQKGPGLTCKERWSQSGQAGVACQANEMLTGGGCTCPGGTLRSSYAAPEGQSGVAAAAWQCDGQCPGGLKAVAICCSVP